MGEAALAALSAAIPAIVSASGSALSTGLNAGTQANLNRVNRGFHFLNGQLQRFYDLRDRADERNYNSPSSQVQRLLEAGLNPNLAASGGSNTVNSTKTDIGTPPVGNPIDFGGVGNILTQAVNQYFQVQQMQMAKALNDAQINELQTRAERNRTLSFLDTWRGFNQKYDYYGRSDIGYWSKKGTMMDNQNHLIEQKTEKELLENFFRIASFNNRLSTIDLENQMLNTKIDLNKGLTNLNNKRGQYYDKLSDYYDKRITAIDDQNKWNSETKESRLALLNAAVQVAQTEAGWAETEKKIKAAGGIENLILRPIEDVLKVFSGGAGSFIQNLLGFGKNTKNPYNFESNTTY